MMRHAAAFLFLGMLIVPGVAEAAEIKVLSVPPWRSTMLELIPQFEKSGDKIAIEYGLPPQLVDSIQKNDTADVLIAPTPVITKLKSEGKIAEAAEFAQVGMGVAVRTGAAKPDISSVDAFKQTLLEAKSIAHIDPASGAPGGIYLANLFEQLGIAADLKDKTRHLRPAETRRDASAEGAVAAGEVELALSLTTAIASSPGIELVGPLPTEIQNYIQFSAGILASSKNAETAANFVRFVSSPEAATLIEGRGFELLKAGNP